MIQRTTGTNPRTYASPTCIRSRTRSRTLPIVLLAALAGCAHRQAAPTTVNQAEPVTTLEMDPMKITAVSGEGGTTIEAYDASELFEQAGAALSQQRWDDAIRGYERLLKEFDGSRYTRASVYNAGLAHQGKRDWAGAVVHFKRLADSWPDTADAKDALFQLGATYAEMGNWPASIETFARVLERQDLSADDRLEAMARRGFGQFKLRDLESAERTFKSAIAYHRQIEAQERLETDFYLGLIQYHLGEIPHERFRAVPLRLPEAQMNQDLEDKARWLLSAQQQYVDAIKIGNPQWASASGYQIGSMYEELYEAFMHAPVPPELLQPAQAEKREVYYEELRKKIRILLEKSLRIHEKNLLMAERLGVQNEWRDKSKQAYAKMQQMLDPSYRFEFADPSAPAPIVAPPPAPPTPTENREAEPRPAPERDRKGPHDQQSDLPQRQIL